MRLNISRGGVFEMVRIRLVTGNGVELIFAGQEIL